MVSPMWSYPMTATLDLAALKTLAEAATPGPWKTADAGLGPLARSHVVDFGDARVPRTPYAVVYGDPPYFGHSADARYIAAMSPDVARALIARCQAAEAALERIAEDGCDYEGLDPDLGDCLESPVPCAPCIARAALDAKPSPDDVTLEPDR
jgi:hypothetical protein